MLTDAPATLEAALLATDDWEILAELIVRLSDSTDDEKGIAAAALADASGWNWGPYLSLVLVRMAIREMEGLEERFMHRVIDASADYLSTAIDEGDLERAEEVAGIAFNQAEALVKVKGTEG